MSEASSSSERAAESTNSEELVDEFNELFASKIEKFALVDDSESNNMFVCGNDGAPQTHIDLVSGEVKRRGRYRVRRESMLWHGRDSIQLYDLAPISGWHCWMKCCEFALRFAELKNDRSAGVYEFAVVHGGKLVPFYFGKSAAQLGVFQRIHNHLKSPQAQPCDFWLGRYPFACCVRWRLFESQYSAENTEHRLLALVDWPANQENNGSYRSMPDQAQLLVDLDAFALRAANEARTLVERKQLGDCHSLLPCAYWLGGTRSGNRAHLWMPSRDASVAGRWLSVHGTAAGAQPIVVVDTPKRGHLDWSSLWLAKSSVARVQEVRNSYARQAASPGDDTRRIEALQRVLSFLDDVLRRLTVSPSERLSVAQYVDYHGAMKSWRTAASKVDGIALPTQDFRKMPRLPPSSPSSS
jgi:hypothetical protein